MISLSVEALQYADSNTAEREDLPPHMQTVLRLRHQSAPDGEFAAVELEGM